MAKKKNTQKNSKGNNKKPDTAVAQAIQEAIDQSEVHTGSVKFMDIRKGYGFIIDDKDGTERFFHHTGIESGRTYKGFMNNDKVSFKIVPGEKGPEAVAINMEVSSNEKNEESQETPTEDPE